MAKHQVFSARSSLWTACPKIFCCTSWWIREQGHSLGWDCLCFLFHDMNSIWWGCVSKRECPRSPWQTPLSLPRLPAQHRGGVAFPPKAGCCNKIMHVGTSELCKKKKKKGAYTIHCLKTFLTFSWFMVFRLLGWTRIHCSLSEACASSANLSKTPFLSSSCLYWL